MIFLIFFLTLLAFVQAALLPVNLVLIILLTKSLISADIEDLYLAFGLGLLLALLLGQPLGLLSLLYISLVTMGRLTRKTRFASYWAAVCLLVGLLVILDHLLEGILFSQSFNVQVLMGELILVVPVYFIVRVLDERFVPQKEIRLKIGK